MRKGYEEALAVGVDLGGTHARATLFEFDPLSAVVASSRLLPTEDASRTPKLVVELVAELVAELGAPQGTPIGVGVAAMLDLEGFVVNAPAFPGTWRTVSLAGLLASHLGRAPVLENDVNAIAFAEHRFGAGRGLHDLLCVFVGTGVGGGLIAGDRLVRGAHGQAGEIGHTIVVHGATARKCGCGRRGCLEAYLGGASLACRAEELRETLAKVMPLPEGALHAGHLDQAARLGCHPALEILGESAELFATSLAAASALLDPGRIVLGGGVLEGAEHLRARTFALYEEKTRDREHGRVELVPSELDARAGVLGAAALART